MNKYQLAKESAKKGKFVSLYDKLEKPSRTKHYDPQAPRFIYRRRPGAFTRKSNKVIKGTSLVLNQPSWPSTKKKDYAQYPKTKPMIGWERIFVGTGKWLERGRKKISFKNNPSHNILLRSYKPKFVPFTRTYKSNLQKRYNLIDKDQYDKDHNLLVGRKVIRK